MVVTLGWSRHSMGRHGASYQLWSAVWTATQLGNVDWTKCCYPQYTVLAIGVGKSLIMHLRLDTPRHQSRVRCGKHYLQHPSPATASIVCWWCACYHIGATGKFPNKDCLISTTNKTYIWIYLMKRFLILWLKKLCIFMPKKRCGSLTKMGILCKSNDVHTVCVVVNE